MKKTLLIGVVILLNIINSNKPVYAQVDLYLDGINVYVNTWGKISIYSLPDTIRQLYQATILVGTGPNSVYDYYNDSDVEDSLRLLASPSFGDYEIYGSFNNNYSGEPPNVLEKLNIYCWQYMNSILVKFTVINRESYPINAIVGFELVPEIEGSTSGGDTVIYSTISKIISVKKTESVGFKPLSDNFVSLGAFVWYSGYRVDSVYYNWLTYSTFDSLFINDPNNPNVDDPVLIPAFNTVTVAPNDSIVQFMAIAYGVNESEMLTGIQQIQQKYDELTSIEFNQKTIPNGYVLEQNYPNPFNPNTKIRFSISSNEFVTLKVFDVLGNEVANLVNEELTSGIYQYDFDASNLSSGVYYYKLKAGSFSETKKMILIR